MNDDENTQVLLSLARIEGSLKLIDSRLDGLGTVGNDHENRLRSLESRPQGITPRVLFTSLVSVATVVGTLVSVGSNLVSR